MRTLELLERAGQWGPVFFGIGFIAPLVSQSLQAADVSAPFGLGTLPFGLLVGTSLGLVARQRRSWL